MNGTHFMHVCQFGQVHDQCRCASPVKGQTVVPCPTPEQCARIAAMGGHLSAPPPQRQLCERWRETGCTGFSESPFVANKPGCETFPCPAPCRSGGGL